MMCSQLITSLFKAKLILIVFYVLILGNLQAQISESSAIDTIFFLKKSNPNRTIILPTNKIELAFRLQNRTWEYGYITDMKDSSITFKKYSDEKYLRNEKRTERKLINKDSTLSRSQKKIRKRALYYQEEMTVNLKDVNEIRIKNRDLKIPATLLKAGDYLLISQPILMIFSEFIPINGLISNYGETIFFGFIILDGIIVFSDFAFQHTHVYLKDWAIGSTFND